jgi:hypothetical protein
MRFNGVVGYGESQETLPNTGVWEPVITEVNYTGDVTRDMRKQGPDDKVNTDLSVNNVISIVADKKAFEHFYLMKYVMWQGVRWTVDTVEVKPPRLLLYLGKVYNGPTP